MMGGGTVVDASVIQAPSSTKNAAKEHDPETKLAAKPFRALRLAPGRVWYPSWANQPASDTPPFRAGCGLIRPEDRGFKPQRCLRINVQILS